MPVLGRVIDDGAVEVRDGRITAVDRASCFVGGPVEDLGEVALLPGFVNPHTHLELSHLAGRVSTDEGFVSWVEKLVRVLWACGDAEPQIKAAVRSGIRQSLAAGVTAVGDITRLPELVRPLLREAPLRAVSFGEVIAVGSMRSHLAAALTAATDAAAVSPSLRIGVSPHSPYTVEPDGLRKCAERAQALGLPLAVHLAETDEEAAFTTEHRGELKSYLARLQVWDDAVPCPQRRPVQLAADTGLLIHTTVIAHANYVTDTEILQLADAGAHVVFCPRTHAAFGHAPHRYRDMLDAGVNVCVGTDSLASSPSLSVLDELRWLHGTAGGPDPHTLLGMGTIRGARALGWDDAIGSLTTGKSADFAVVALDPHGPPDPVENILCGERAVTATYVRGELVE